MQNSDAYSSPTQDCSGIVEHIYTHPDLKLVLSRIKPEAIQQDIRQEMAISLLEQPCEKISKLFQEGNLTRYAIRICWNMAIGNGKAQHPLSTTYARKQLIEAMRFMYANSNLSSITDTENIANKAVAYLESKNTDRVQAHEARIFWKYVELGSGRKVADYFGIPQSHVRKVLLRVKKELKCTLLD